MNRGLHSIRGAIAMGAFIGSIAVCLYFVASAKAHDAPPTLAQAEGWAYGWDCCSYQDCRREGDGEIIEGKYGYRVRSTGELIAYGDKRLRMSKDQYFHRCASAGDFKSDSSLCLYVPHRGF